MKRLMLSSTLLLTCMAMIFYLSSGNALQINRSNLLLWRITLYAAISGMGWRHYDHFPPYRPVIRRIALWFIVLVALNEIVPEVFR
ncbi:hypothetical protein CD683_001141 [Salmonella enterica subsp. enterica serovar Herston]|uniref:Uncharacterized protein n=1 Tax=Salmonella enterica TaxID=28901 RepID=A0A744FP08_SALER|nr:hypothetical protein [Salmonella enterica]EAW1630202.1 hypothetical protein [Salmonella enterica subsp. enterica]EBY7389537.1 hypothetical protein [Salmonella enterica subsp. enterica serovar Herston]ECT8840256.1 hypothetical protein [Salmonella enterica subsp. enterica serovar Muenchen]EAZ4930111.1 hypothetical protein [Salmonella enterica]EBI4239798.1 hypothetical protein [Salmonella enterica]